jgi:uncharacterized protein with HEPN domain
LQQDVIIWWLLVIAKAANQVSQNTRHLPNISWQEINEMRNRLYKYDDVNFNIV